MKLKNCGKVIASCFIALFIFTSCSSKITSSYMHSKDDIIFIDRDYLKVILTDESVENIVENAKKQGFKLIELNEDSAYLKKDNIDFSLVKNNLDFDHKYAIIIE